MSEFVLLAAKHKAPTSGVEAVVFLVILAVAAVFILLQPTKEFVWKNGVPCCPQCGRQVSLKGSRPNCRSCGADLMTGKPLLDLKTPQTGPTPEEQRQAELRRRVWQQEQDRRLAALEEEADRRRAEWDARKAERRREREDRRQAKLASNGGYSDIQLYGFGALLILIPAGLAFGLFLLMR